MANSAGTEVGDINYLSSQNMNLRNLVHGGSIILTAQDSAGTNRTILNGDPDAQTTLRADTQLNLQTNAGESAIVCQQNAAVNIYYDGTLTAATGVEAFNIYANDSVSTSTVQLQLREASGSLRAQMGYSGSSTFFIRSVIHGAAIAINAEDSGGVLRNILNADPDNTTTLTGDTTLELSTNASVRLSINSVGDFNYNDNLLDRAEMGDYSVQVEDLGVVANANVTLTYSNGNAFEFDIENWSTNRTVTLSGGPPSGTYGVMEVKITQDNTAARTITWAGGVFVWLNGTAHPLNPTLGGISIYVFETWDGGGTWYASGADYG